MPFATASSPVTISGEAVARVAVVGIAPGVVPAEWAIVPGENAATITSYPSPPVAPSWTVDVNEDVLVVYDFPRFLVQATPQINVEVVGSASGRTNVAGRRVAEAFDSANGGTLIDARRS